MLSNNQLSRGAALWLPMGVGKTKVVIDVAEVMFNAGLIQRVLVVSPLSIVDTWEQELTKHGSKSVWNSVIGNKGGKENILQLYRSSGTNRPSWRGHLHWALTNVEGLTTIKDWPPFDLVVVDESTTIKTRSAQRTKALMKHFAYAPYKIVMSGNPITKGPEEVFAQYEFVEPGVFGTAPVRFREKYFLLDFYKGVMGFKSEELKAEYEEKFHSISFTRRKQDCLDLPPKVYEVIKVEMGEEQARAYKDMRDEALVCYEDATCSAPVVLTKLMRLSQITGGYVPLGSLEGDIHNHPFERNPKLGELVELVKNLKKEQVVIWARFKWEIRAIEAALKNENIDCVTFYGDVSYANRLEARKDFREGLSQVFIGNAATGGKGLNDLVGAETVIYYSNDYSAENRQQSEDRNHRNGTVKVTYIDLIMKDTIDEEVLRVLRGNEDVSNAILQRGLQL